MKLLLTSHDGVELFDTSNAWVIRNPVQYGKVEPLKILDNVFDLYRNKGYLFFAHEENANRFLQQLKKPTRMFEFRNPVPVIVENNIHGYVLYVRDGSTWENDIWCVVHCECGIVRHYRSDQIRIHHNATFDISKPNNQ